MESLPFELIIYILEFLETKDYLSCLETSKLFHKDDQQYSRKKEEYHKKKFWLLTKAAVLELSTTLVRITPSLRGYEKHVIQIMEEGGYDSMIDELADKYYQSDKMQDNILLKYMYSDILAYIQLNS